MKLELQEVNWTPIKNCSRENVREKKIELPYREQDISFKIKFKTSNSNVEVSIREIINAYLKSRFTIQN